MLKKGKSFVLFLTGLLLVVLLAVPAYADGSFAIQKIEQTGADYVFLEWDAYDGADGYALYRSQEDEPFKLIKSVPSCSTYNYGLENGETYSYKVCPYRVLADGRKDYLTESEGVSLQIGVKTPTDLRASVCGKTSMSVSWNGDPLADNYLFYQSTDNKNWTLVKSVSGTSTVTYGLNEGETYFFRVKASRNINGTVRGSAYSDAVKCTMGIAAPGYLTIKSANTNSVELEWESVQGATGYRLYRAENDGEYKLVKTITGTTTKNYSLNQETTYTYRIAAIAEDGQNTFKSLYTYAEPIRLSLGQAEDLHVERLYSNGVCLRWDPVEGATGYRLYRTGEEGNSTLVKTVAENSTNTYSLTEGQCYSFSVKPICKSGAVTVNGGVCEEVKLFFTPLPTLTVTQQEVNKLRLSWNNVAGAEKYRLRFSQTGSAEKLEEVSSTDFEYELTGSNGLTVSLCAVKNGIESVGVSGSYTPVYEEPLSFAIANAVNATQISLAWEHADNAAQYEVQRFDPEENAFMTIGIYTDTSLVDTDVLAETAYQYRYRAGYGSGDNAFWGNWSEVVTVTTPGEPKYRALLIGEENYDTVLSGPINDIQAMSNMLSGMTAMDWEIYRQADATRDEIVSLISLAFAGAAGNDVSLFYYSGHGVTSSGDYYSGALVTVDYNYIPMQDLAELLSAVPGKVIVLLDSCGSGAAISGDSSSASTYAADHTPTFDPASFNAGVVQAFSQYNGTEQNKTAELATEKFYVLTSSAYEQNSRSVSINNIWGGAFTRAFVGGAGYDFNSQVWSGVMPADGDGDNCLTLQECYVYCRNQVSEYQDVQVYPLESSVRLLFK